jgi:hypothetical protein
MTKLYKTTVNDTGMRSDGLGFFTQYGEPRTIDGTPMVVLPYGVMVPAEGWHADHGGALLAAAQRIEALGHRLLAQADKLRVEAAASEKQEVTA